MDKILHLFSKNRTILILLLILSLSSFTTLCAQTTNTFTANNSNWNTPGNWSLGLVPISSHDVVIPLGKTVTVDVSSVAHSITISGFLKIADQKTLTVGYDFTVNSGGAFNMPGGSSVATLVVYGNFYNYGISDFWKSNVIICGDLISPSTSSLQNSGIVVVGGNIIGDFSLSGSAGNIYALNPNATVSITPSSVGSTVIPGADVPASEGTALITLINQTIYLGSCPFTVSDVMDVTACAGSNAIFTVSTSGASPQYQWQVKTSINNDWSNLSNDAVYSGVLTTTLTITNINALMNGYKYRALVTSSSCTQSGNNGKLNLTAGPSIPIVGVITQPTCALATGSVVLSGLPSSGILNPGNISYSGTSYTVSGLVPGTYNFTVTTNSCYSTGSANVLVLPLATTTWNGSSWSNGLPSSDKNIVFNGDYASSSDIYACSCTVNPGTNVIVNSGNTLNMSNAITVVGGTITLENNASLMQSGYTGANYGNINVKRNSTPLKLNDYTYWSSPTTGTQKLIDFSPATSWSKFYTYHNSWAYAAPGTDTFTKGIGYAICAPQGISSTVPAIVSHQFTGVPNNGNIDVAVATGPLVANRLIGNPYPSAIDAIAFINANLVGTGTSNQTISGTLYFWTHNHGLIGNNYASSDYATYNLTGGTAVAAGTGNITTPTRYIASGQGFFVHTLANGLVSFNNSMRTGTNNTNLYRSSNATTSSTTLESHRIWLNLTNSNTSNFSQALVGYVETATNDNNPGFDGLYNGTDQHVLYSLINNANYTIQARALPFVNTDVVPLGFKTNVSGSTTISIDHVDGLFLSNQNIYLVDQLLNITHDLKLTPYTFSSLAGTFNNRFVLKYTTSTLGLDDLNDLTSAVTVASMDKQIRIQSQLEPIEKVIIYDILGRQIFENNKVNSNEALISDLINHQTLIVKIILSNTQVVTKKLIY